MVLQLGSFRDSLHKIESQGQKISSFACTMGDGNKFDLHRFESLENGINHDTIVESYVDNVSQYPHSGVAFCDPNLETPNEIGIEFYFDPLLESACRTSANIKVVVGIIIINKRMNQSLIHYWMIF